jgi:hypothetical protein
LKIEELYQILEKKPVSVRDILLLCPENESIRFFQIFDPYQTTW